MKHKKNIVFPLFVLYRSYFSYLLFFASSIEVRASDSLKLLFDRGLQESRDGEFLKALDTWEKFLELSPEDPAALSNRGMCACC